ncbi:MAG: TraR/DksA family transcriptional regulator [Calditrichaeota bacterium]|nr:TraR/DksA family transcriptional regulator [Calditrichota bacterium]
MEGSVLQQIDDAVARIEEGSYGECVICGAEIHPKRLEAVPYARLCISCKEKEEKGLLV